MKRSTCLARQFSVIGDIAILSLATRPFEVDTGNTKNDSFTYY